MIKILRVGDPHITVRNLKESEALFKFIIEQASLHKVNRIELLGDLMHTHAVIRMEVLDFWTKSFKEMSRVCSILALVGNHDQPGSKEKEQNMNGLNIFAGDWVTIINTPRIIDNIAYIPYMSDKDAFITAANGLYAQGAEKLLVAHQNFTVPLYHDMIDQSLVLQEAIITGHIHEQKQVGKTFQVGTPKWDTMTDANENKGIWIYEHLENGAVASKKFISTAGVVTPIEKVTVTEGEEDPTLNEKATNYIELVGTTAWINQMKKKYKGLGAIKARPSDRKHVNINKDKVFSLFDHLDAHFKPIDGVSKDEMKRYLKGVMDVTGS